MNAVLVRIDDSPLAAAALACGLWLASRTSATVHVILHGAALPSVPRAQRHAVVTHAGGVQPARDLLDAIRQYHVDLAILAPAAQATMDKVTREVIERSPAPVLVLRQPTRLPWRSLLVPVSGDVDTDAALAFALQLADQLELEVTIVHVVEDAKRPAMADSALHDQAHHENRLLLNEYVARACPMCGPSQLRRIVAVRVARGDVESGLRTAVEDAGPDVMVLGWHQHFAAGRARILKALLREPACACVLVRGRRAPHSRLKVGSQLLVNR